MTVDFLWQEALFPSKDIRRNGWKSLSELKGRTLGVDLSYWLHKALVQSTVAIKLHFDTEPIKPVEIIEYLDTNYRICYKELDIKLLFVVEGNATYQKRLGAAESRRASRDTARKAIEQFFSQCEKHPETVTDADRNMLVKNLKNLTSRTEAVTSMVVKWMQDQQIPFIGAPWEGEWQLVQMEKEGRIDGIIANDGDCFILGGRRIIFDIDFGKRQFRELNVMEATAKYNENNNHYRIFKYKQENLAIISCFFGNDYIKRINGIGKKKIWKILDSLQNDKIWTVAEMRQAIENYDRRYTQSSEFWHKFEECFSLIKHCPVLHSRNNVVPLLSVPSGTTR